jgi:glycyl-tRNA synthetase beta chain
VIADFAERQASILQQVTDLATKENGKALIPAALLDEVTGLVEYPVPLVCSFEAAFFTRSARSVNFDHARQPKVFLFG